MIFLGNGMNMKILIIGPGSKHIENARWNRQNIDFRHVNTSQEAITKLNSNDSIDKIMTNVDADIGWLMSRLGEMGHPIPIVA